SPSPRVHENKRVAGKVCEVCGDLPMPSTSSPQSLFFIGLSDSHWMRKSGAERVKTHVALGKILKNRRHLWANKKRIQLARHGVKYFFLLDEKPRCEGSLPSRQARPACLAHPGIIADIRMTDE